MSAGRSQSDGRGAYGPARAEHIAVLMLGGEVSSDLGWNDELHSRSDSCDCTIEIVASY